MLLKKRYGAVLSQEVWRIKYISEKLNDAQRNWFTYKQEFYNIFSALFNLEGVCTLLQSSSIEVL